jgi:hypothetical protein
MTVSRNAFFIAQGLSVLKRMMQNSNLGSDFSFESILTVESAAADLKA